MPDHQDIAGGVERARVPGLQPHELAAFANRHGLSIDEARKIIAEAGPGREAADAAAEKHKRG